MISAGAFGLDLGVAETLPIAKALLRQVFLDQGRGRLVAGFDDGVRSLVGTLQMTGDPERAGGQLFGQAFESFRIVGVGRHVGLTVEPAPMCGNWGVAYPPPTRDRKIV